MVSNGTPPFTVTTIPATSTVKFNETKTTATPFQEYGMEVSLYADVGYTAYTVWYEANKTTVTAKQTQYYEDYSDYVIQIKCNMRQLPSDAATAAFNPAAPAARGSSGCCLQDLSVLKGGGYCLIWDQVTSSMDTYLLTDVNFNKAVLTPYTIDPSWKQAVVSTNVGFETFSCSGADQSLQECKKYQYWPAASWANGFRFEPGNRARGYNYDFAATATSDRWIDQRQYLLGAKYNFAVSSVALLFSLKILAF